MIHYRLVLVVLTISFLAGSAVASLDRDAKGTTVVGRKLKSSKSDKNSKVDTEPPTASPTTSPTEPPTEIATSKVPTNAPTDSLTKSPTTSPTGSPTSKLTESPTTAPKFKKVFFATEGASFAASADAFDEAVADQFVQFLDDQPCGNQECLAKANSRDCSRDQFTLSLIFNSNNKVQKFKGKSFFGLSDAPPQTSKDCCANPTCVGKYAESESFDANSKVIFLITSNKNVITPKSGSWYELVVALYNADASTDELVASNVYRGNEGLSEFEGEFTGVPNGNYYLRIFPALYSYKGKSKVKSKFEVGRLEIATN